MCIIFFIACDDLSTTPGYKLILASNRDEVYTRPAKAAAVWENAEHVIGGRDMEGGREGGTWLGVSGADNKIKLAALLNLPGEKKLAENAAGRGPIVSNYLTGDMNNFDYSDSILRSKNEYNSFNFVSIEFNALNHSCQILHTSNTPRGIQEFPNNSVLGFSNSSWMVPLNKVDHGKELFTDVIRQKGQTKEELVTQLMSLLSDETKFPDDQELIRRLPGDKRFPNCSSIYFSVPELNYGSRTKTVILIDSEDKMDFYEESIELQTGTWHKTHLQRQLL